MPEKSRFDIRQIGLIFVIAILFAVFVFTSINAVFQEPDYSDFCKNDFQPRPIQPKEQAECPEFIQPSSEEMNQCSDDGGRIEYEYDAFNCPTSYHCETCGKEYEKAREEHNFIVFIVTAVLSLIAIIAALYLPKGRSSLNEWVGTGFMLGSLITLFISTAMVFDDLNRFIKPVIILVELILVIYLAYKKLGEK